MVVGVGVAEDVVAVVVVEVGVGSVVESVVVVVGVGSGKSTWHCCVGVKQS
jgi:hypothetical protein